MISIRDILQFTLFSTTANPPSHVNPKIRWGACDEAFTNITLAKIECATLSVPLDYTEPQSNERLGLELLRVPATFQPSRGSIQLNFGGPGATGRDGLALLGPLLLSLSGGHYDLIAFDPRGTGNNLPFSCINTHDEGVALSTELTFSNASDVALGRLWARGAINANLCYERANKTGALIGTAFVARDLMTVVDALDEDGLLRYWGFSYGTTLGATAAAMFPDKIDKMILDGVQNPHDYYHALADFEEWTDSDKAFSGIFSWCFSAPERCSLASRYRNAAELEQAVWALVDDVKFNPIAMGTYLLDYTVIKALLVQNLYSTYGWPRLTMILEMLLTGEIQDAPAAIKDSVALIEDSKLIMAVLGIHCGDRSARAASLDNYMPSINQLYNTSRLMGDITSAISMTCAQWNIEPKERYEGSFQAQTKEPVLIIGNTYDGLTPLASAQNVSAGFHGSVVLEVNGYGHASISLPSTCTLKFVSAYWNDGSLPRAGTVCEVDGPLYGNVTWANVIMNTMGSDHHLLEQFIDVPNVLPSVLGWLK
ncbi:proteinase [Xylariales sp. PMI_506]|nr:proteinase [Xylariales sp. PMI_506]